jgi:diguanylate cyclase (GGDEF)-like protein/PAS domain S-box-containing protein
MGWVLTSYIIALIFTAAFVGVIAFAAWRQRSMPGGISLVLLLVAIVEWVFGTAIELAAVTIPAKIFWAKVEYFGTVSAPLLYFIFALTYSRGEKQPSLNKIAPLWLIPAITLVLVWTNDYHFLIWNSFTPSPAGHHLIIYGHGPWFWIFVTYSYVLMLVAALILIRTALRLPSSYRRQTIAILFSSITPWLGNLVYISGLSPFPGLDLTPLAFAVTGLILFLGVGRFRLFELMPVAREALIENMGDGVMVLDGQHHVVDVNPAASKLLGIPINKMIGQSAETVFARWPELISRFLDVSEAETEVEVQGERHQKTSSSGYCSIDLRIKPLLNRSGKLSGRLLVFRDVTARKNIEQALRVQEETTRQFSGQLSALHEVGIELSLTKSVSDLCQKAVELGRHRLGFDRIGIWLLDPQDATYMVGTFSIDEQGRLRDERSQRLPITDDMIWNDIFTGKASLHSYGDIFNDKYGMVGHGERAAAALWDGKDIIGQASIDNLLSGRPISEHQQELLMLYARLVGHLVTLKQAEQSEREQRILSESLSETAALLTETLDLNEVFERILANVGRVVPHDSANLMMIEGEHVRITHSRGYGEHGLQAYVDSFTFKWKDMPNLRQMVETHRPCLIPDAHSYAGWIQLTGSAWIRSFAGAPISIKDEVVGFLNLDSATPAFFTPLHAERLQTFADQAAIAIQNARLYAEVQRLAIVDELTKVYNYRGLLLLGPREVERAQRFKRSLSALFFDIDNFRDFNNRYSHAVGNLVLQAVADCTHSHMRSVDLVVRYGGEEFVVLLPETGISVAALIAERLRRAVEARRVQTDSGELGVTISVGVAELTPDMEDLPALINAADRAEHTAKDCGRNQVICYGNIQRI